MNNYKRIYYLFTVLVIFETIALFCFHYFGWKADQAMDKTGIGDAKMCLYWSSFAGYSFWALTCFWGLAILIYLLSKIIDSQRKANQYSTNLSLLIKISIFGPILAFPLSYIFLLILT